MENPRVLILVEEIAGICSAGSSWEKNVGENVREKVAAFRMRCLRPRSGLLPGQHTMSDACLLQLVQRFGVRDSDHA